MARWGIVGLGEFAQKWAKDVFENYKLEQNAPEQVLVAVVSTSSLAKADQFVRDLKLNQDTSVSTFDDYNQFLEADIDVVYVAAPNSAHFSLAKSAIDAGKHVLLEKTFTTSHEEAVILQKSARKNNVFLLEAVWTRFLPSTKKIWDLVDQKTIGDIIQVSADLSHLVPYEPQQRLFNPDLGGGVLFDSIIYSITWTFGLLRSKSSNYTTTGLTVASKSGVDGGATVVLAFPDLGAFGIATGSFYGESPPYAVTIQGSKGTIYVDRASRPSKAIVHVHGESERELDLNFEGLGYFYEANEVARAIKRGDLETELYPVDQSVEIVKILEEIRNKSV
ncbi:hypothetical protein PSN45_002653 [Yamadazyma tenuis]|uniref:D-xylose 1-dehydrogenase (NADP(+), D-xylono-1,5-lactone-forming) n=1 Tax=Candida tenuis (strain ATCC 10573 / BCRC 21748 / CBS 615 / JCM 9827 / NBRC 10315 / NRRL Y-1498 / VKM Y-70) TaxID=590646 RepID=G3AX95_CANTC|nr:NAD(P)-binding protein [Yamadazyma tenuis ATCC 10573]EGV66723.1 NAD(P)-binding protein [Yamadazyma tenuis ATCC 10573]WEJ95141.1 hypothetical protein PSN45_002653 [Yamadazyma tenuis]